MDALECKKCGAKLDKAAKICSACGANLLPAKTGISRLTLISLALLGLGVLGYFVIPMAMRNPVPATTEIVETPDVEGTRSKAENGDAIAQRKMGAIYAKGQGVKDDYKQAAKWYRLAADQGDAEAQIALGELYEAGQGVTRDSTEAARCYRQAAEKGSAAGQYSLALMYLMGNGVAKDDGEALKWYRQAADQGYALALFHMGMRYKKGQGVAPDPIEAYKWLSLAAAKDIAEAIEIRDELKSTMTRDQVAEGRRRADNFIPKKLVPAMK